MVLFTFLLFINNIFTKEQTFSDHKILFVLQQLAFHHVNFHIGLILNVTMYMYVGLNICYQSIFQNHSSFFSLIPLN